jgi:NAD(P)H-dependent flavin oxidoreductase YrpB (nitropropane dioxygenase family)
MQIDSLFDTPLTQRLNCRYPVVQTAMGWVSDANLVSATTLAGGFGFLAGATIPEDELEAEIQTIIHKTGGSNFGLNFHMFQPNAMQCVEFAIKYKLKAVSYGRGPDRDTITRLKEAGVLCIPTVGALKHALKAIELGADMITIQGSEGGGHTGEVPTSILLNQVLDNVSVPVIAAGGFSNGRGLASALASGAAGIAMGTRFMMTSDSPTPEPTLAEYINVNDPAQIKVTLAVDGMRHRMIANQFIQNFENKSGLSRLLTALSSAWYWKTSTDMSMQHMFKLLWQGLKEDPTAVSQLVMAANQPVLLQHAMVDGRPNDGILPSGQVAATIDNLPSVAELIDEIMTDASALLNQLYSRLKPREIL